MDILAEPAYAGGPIGFFLATPESPDAPGTCAEGDCCATFTRTMAGNGRMYYTESLYNSDADINSFVHTLAYSSQVWPARIYLAWKAAFAGGDDNSFQDLVVGVEGVSGGTSP